MQQQSHREPSGASLLRWLVIIILLPLALVMFGAIVLAGACTVAVGKTALEDVQVQSPTQQTDHDR